MQRWRGGNAIIVILYNIAISAGEIELDEENRQEDEAEQAMAEAQGHDQERVQLGNAARARLSATSVGVAVVPYTA